MRKVGYEYLSGPCLDLTLGTWGWTRVPWRAEGKISSYPDSVIPALSPQNQTGPVHVCKLVIFSFIQKYCASRVLQVIVCEKISWGLKRGRCEKTLVQNMIYFHWQPGPDLRCFYDTHLQSPDLTGKLCWALQTRINIMRFSSPHNTAQYWWAWEVMAMFCLSQHREERGEGDKHTNWDNDNPVTGERCGVRSLNIWEFT